MPVTIGSARIDENGRAHGGRAGDQTGNEVSTQNWYKHSKGWVCLRPKSATAAEKIAEAMQHACDNQKIGYDQDERYTLYDWLKQQGKGFDPAMVTVAVETDCSALVRVCLANAGIMVGDFYTGNEVEVLMSTGQFTQLDDAKAQVSLYLKRGDVLVTKTTGHTVVVLTDGSKADDDQQPEPIKEEYRKEFAEDKKKKREGAVTLYRLYNKNTGEHFYTHEELEVSTLIDTGWRYEGIAWYSPEYSTIPVFRLYNPNSGDHHYTKAYAEKNMLVKVGWSYEGIGWYSDTEQHVPVFRQYNPNAKTGTHNYTTSRAERDYLVSIGWRDEGIGWYAV